MDHPELTATVLQLAARYAGDAPGPDALGERIPASHYTDPKRFATERQRLFLQRPILLAHETQIPNPGDAIVQDWLGLPLITIRDKEGDIGTFLNVCRHRGMRLVQDEGQTCLRSLVCPYHQWTYGLDGQLRNIPRRETFTELDTNELGLVAIPTAVRSGLIWIQAEGEMDIDTHLAGLGRDFDYFSLGQFSFCQRSVRTVEANWKLIQDAFLDGYHVTRLHKNTVGPFFPDALANSEFVGDHLRNAVARNEIEEAVGCATEALGDIKRLVTFSYTTFPNAVLVFQPDYTSVISLFPQAPDRTVFVHTMLTPYPPKTPEQHDHFQRSFQLIDEGVFAAEDLFVAAGAQRGLSSGANESLLFGGLEEAAARFHRLIEQRLA
jgi:phenylpropionate dioxygenase-like ring-hydroxylating dioxygenase large terminal subunit